MGAMELNQMRFEVFEANYASRALQCYCRYPIQQFLRFRNIRSLTWIVLVLYQNMTAGTFPNCPTFCGTGTARALFRRSWVV